MRIFGLRRGPEHRAGVIYVYDKHSDLVPYYSAVCKCGWFAEPVETLYPDLASEQRMAAAACAHDPAADTSVGFRLDDPPNV
jgi:hypothetical protein